MATAGDDRARGEPDAVRGLGRASARWSGIRSHTIDLGGLPAFYLSCEGAGTAADAPTHLLVPNPAGSATLLIDVLAALSRHGRVIAVDLPRSYTGRTAPSGRRGSFESDASFLRALTGALGLDAVVVHGWSAGAMVAELFADLEPGRVAGLVLVAPALPPPLTAREARRWRTLGPVGLAVAAPVARTAVRLLGRRFVDVKLRALSDPSAFRGSRWDVGGGELRLSGELTRLAAEELGAVRPRQLADVVTVMTSTTSEMFVRRRRVQTAMRRVPAPTLVLWGDQDRLIPRAWIDAWAAHRPDWSVSVFAGVGHTLPLEVPERYADTVGDWMAGWSDAVGQEHDPRRPPPS